MLIYAMYGESSTAATLAATLAAFPAEIRALLASEGL